MVVDMFLIIEEITEEELRRRLSDSVRCHQVMRSVFINQKNARLLQVVLKNWEIPIFTVDMSSLAVSDENVAIISDAQSRYLDNLRQLYEIKPFTSSKVMFEAGLIKISKNRSILVLAYSHLLLDGIGKSKILNELLGESAALSDVFQYNRYMQHILSDSYRKDSLVIWRKALVGHSPLTEIQTSSGSEIGRCIKSFVAGKQFSGKAALFCHDNHVTISSLCCLALGKVLMNLYGSDEVGFLSVNSGRDVKNQELTGMFSMGVPIFIKKEDTPATVQEQIVSAMSRPLPDLDKLGLESQGARNHIFLSIQNYLKPQISKKFELITNYNMSSRTIVTKHAPKVSRPLAIFLFPEPVFSYIVSYDGQLINADFAQKLGGSLLTQLRSLIER